MKLDIDLLEQYKFDGYLINQQHPTHPLLIWNYSQKTQYEGFWNEITLMCRGLVTDLEGNVISKGFNKFFNIEEGKHTPTDKFEVYQKLDGQYIGVFWYNGEMIVNSRGSFTSPYAVEAKRLLKERYSKFVKSNNNTNMSLNKLTYCFELIGFEQIVVKYDRVDLLLTGIFNKFGTDWFEELKDNWDLNWVIKYDALDYTQIKQLNWQNSEGFVIKFENGDRCKIKFEDYIKLHRQMTNLSTTAIWEALRDGKPVSEILSNVPDEFFDRVRDLEEELNDEFKKLERTIQNYFVGLRDLDRKEYAQIVLRLRRSWSNVLFFMFDGKDYSKLIWN